MNATTIESERPAARKVLIIDDEWLVAVDVQRTLRRAGYVVDEIVTTSAKALPTFERVRPDLVVLDIALDRQIDGVEVAARLRARSPVPVVFLSAHHDAATLRRAMRASPNGFVVKPFTEAQLVTAVELALNVPPVDDGKLAAQRTLERIAAVLAESRVASTTDPERLPGYDDLSSREREILDCLLDHQRVPGIARSLSISEHTVRNHLKSIFAKLGVHSQEELLDLVVRGAKSATTRVRR